MSSSGDGAPATVSLEFDAAANSLDSVQRAAYSLSRLCTTDVSLEQSRITCVLHPRSADTNLDLLAHEFRAEVTDQVLRARIAEETADLRRLIFALAYSKTGLVDP